MVEFVQGFNGYLISHEIFMYLLDAVQMFVLMVVMNVFHPAGVLGRVKGELVQCETLVVQGRDSERRV